MYISGLFPSRGKKKKEKKRSRIGKIEQERKEEGKNEKEKKEKGRR
jgi:hypothetical protein